MTKCVTLVVSYTVKKVSIENVLEGLNSSSAEVTFRHSHTNHREQRCERILTNCERMLTNCEMMLTNTFFVN